MERDVAAMYTPGSPLFHQFLTPDQIVQRYAPSVTQAQQVQDWLTHNGYTIVSMNPLRSAIKVLGTVSAIERSLHIGLQAFPVVGREFFMQQGIPTLPSSINSLVTEILGLSDFAVAIPLLTGLAPSATQLTGNCSKYGAKQTLTRNKLAAAYQINKLYQQGWQGQGMGIAVAEFGDAYDPRDVANYDICVGIVPPTIQNIDVDGRLAPGPGEGEAALDLELISGLAPKAQILDYQADVNKTPFAQALVDVFNRVATDDKVQALSVSYGASEDALSTTEEAAINKSLRTLAAEGISVFISSGDCGAYSRRIHNIAVVSFPASAPYAIAVGGTYLQVSDSNLRTSEVAWGGDDGASACQNEWGSGGGVSQNSLFKRPPWQAGRGTTAHYDGGLGNVFTPSFAPVVTPNGLRQVPDLSAAAFPNIAIYYRGVWLAAGGTSAAAPIVAAGTLLLDQGLKQHNKSNFGGVPEAYTLANHPGSFHPYNDITRGDNLFFRAAVGWDYVTGWGSPNFNDILQIELTL